MRLCSHAAKLGRTEIPGCSRVGAVVESDVKALLDQLRPGAVYTSIDLWDWYVRMMNEARLPYGARNLFGRMLTALGCERVRIRRTVDRAVHEAHSWVIPGAPRVDEDAEMIEALISRLGGEGIYPVTRIRAAYEELARELNWSWPMNQAELATRLTRRGHPVSTDQGVPVRTLSHGVRAEMSPETARLGP